MTRLIYWCCFALMVAFLAFTSPANANVPGCVAELDGVLSERWNEIGETAFDAERDMTPEEQAEQVKITKAQMFLTRPYSLSQASSDGAMETVYALDQKLSKEYWGILVSVYPVKRTAAQKTRLAEITDQRLSLAKIHGQLALQKQDLSTTNFRQIKADYPGAAYIIAEMKCSSVRMRHPDLI